jgi:hypothetical protein
MATKKQKNLNSEWGVGSRESKKKLRGFDIDPFYIEKSRKKKKEVEL